MHKKHSQLLLIPVYLAFLITKFLHETLRISLFQPHIQHIVKTKHLLTLSSYQSIGIVTGCLLSLLLIKRFSIKWLLSAALLIVSSCLCIFVSNMNTLFFLSVIRFLLGLSIGVIFSCVFATLPVICPQNTVQKHSSSLYLYGFLVMLGSSYMQYILPWKPLLYTLIVLSAVSGILIFVTLSDSECNKNNQPNITELKEILSHKYFFIMLLLISICTAGYNSLISNVAQNLQAHKYTLTEMNVTLTVIQGFGRFILLIAALVTSFTLNKGNVKKNIKTATLYLLICLISLFMASISTQEITPLMYSFMLPYNNLMELTIYIFSTPSILWLFCIFCFIIGIVQPAAKLIILSDLKKINNANISFQAILCSSIAVMDFFAICIIKSATIYGTSLVLGLFVYICMQIFSRQIQYYINDEKCVRKCECEEMTGE